MLSVGLVGLPNAGKSTLFNLLTKRSVPAENFPFTTIDPHDGIVEVPDQRVKVLGDLVNAQKEVYAAIEFRDIAGLIKGASQGAGLGNQFLSHIREVDLILLVVRCFQNDDIIHVENRINPQDDEEILMLELILADQNNLEKQIARLEKDAKTGKDRLGTDKLAIAQSILTQLQNNLPASSYMIESTADRDLPKWRHSLNLLTDKPILKLANINQDTPNVPFASDFDLDILLESTVADLSMEDRLELGIKGETGLDKMIQACYKKLNMATFLTVGEVESRAWTFHNGWAAPECAGVIHTDFEHNFIKAEVISYDDFVTAKSRKSAIEQGKMRMEGKEYLMKDGDVVEFKIGK